ncbi:MAG: twin transmembrane helix small protein [Pseudomonadota bacterium]|jgi:hypothetical protein
MKWMIVGFLVLILASLGSALWYVMRDRGGTRAVRALTLRITLSVALFALVMLAHFTGLITLNGSVR